MKRKRALTILELDCHRLIGAFHQKPVMQKKSRRRSVKLRAVPSRWRQNSKCSLLQQRVALVAKGGEGGEARKSP